MKININSVFKNKTALLSAAESGNIELIEYLINEWGLDISAVDELGQNVLLIAARHGKFKLVKHLLENYDEIMFTSPSTVRNLDRKSTRLNSSHIPLSRMPSSA